MAECVEARRFKSSLKVWQHVPATGPVANGRRQRRGQCSYLSTDASVDRFRGKYRAARENTRPATSVTSPWPDARLADGRPL